LGPAGDRRRAAFVELMNGERGVSIFLMGRNGLEAGCHLKEPADLRAGGRAPGRRKKRESGCGGKRGGVSRDKFHKTTLWRGKMIPTLNPTESRIELHKKQLPGNREGGLCEKVVCAVI